MCTGAEGFMTQHADKIILASSAMKAVGSLLGGKQAEDYYNAQADQAMSDAQARAGKIRKAGSKVQGAARAAYGGSGVSATSGSALAVQEDIARNAGEDALMELLSGKSSAAMSRAAGRNAANAGMSGAGKSLLAGAADQIKANEEASRWRRLAAADRSAAAGLSIPAIDWTVDY